jgi:hypothetical protein
MSGVLGLPQASRRPRRRPGRTAQPDQAPPTRHALSPPDPAWTTPCWRTGPQPQRLRRKRQEPLRGDLTAERGDQPPMNGACRRAGQLPVQDRADQKPRSASPSPPPRHDRWPSRHGVQASRVSFRLNPLQWDGPVTTARPSWNSSTCCSRPNGIDHRRDMASCQYLQLSACMRSGRPSDHSGNAVPVRRTRLAGIDIRRNRMGQGPQGDRCGSAAPRPAHRDVHSGRSRRRAEHDCSCADAPAGQDESARAPGPPCRARSSCVPDRAAMIRVAVATSRI